MPESDTALADPRTGTFPCPLLVSTYVNAKASKASRIFDQIGKNTNSQFDYQE